MSLTLPILVPHVISHGRASQLSVACIGALDCPVSVCMGPANDTNAPRPRIRMTFHRDGFGAPPAHLDFVDCDSLHPKHEQPSLTGIPDELAAQLRQLYWERFVIPEPPDVWKGAETACGYRPGERDWDSMHVHDTLVGYSHTNTLPGASPFPRAQDLREPALARHLCESFSPDQRVFLIAWLLDAAPSHHHHLTALKAASDWLPWLSTSQEWDAFAPAVLLPARPH